jgi:hypothetical protein
VAVALEVVVAVADPGQVPKTSPGGAVDAVAEAEAYAVVGEACGQADVWVPKPE